MVVLSSIPKRAIVSIQPNDESPFEFVDRRTAANIIKSRHVGGRRRTRKRRSAIANVCTFSPGLCKGGSRKRNLRKTRKN